MTKQRAFTITLDTLIPTGAFLRRWELKERIRWHELLWRYLPQTFFIYWIFSFIPVVGGLIYMLAAVSLSIFVHYKTVSSGERSIPKLFLLYYTVHLIGFGGLWAFIGHTVLADPVAKGIGWETGSPFQIELAVYHLGFSIAIFTELLLRRNRFTGLIIAKSVFWYGAALIHIYHLIRHRNVSPLNIGGPLIGDLVYPTILLILLRKSGSKSKAVKSEV